jgi:endonuclease YncB( thermonuclease family)
VAVFGATVTPARQEIRPMEVFALLLTIIFWFMLLGAAVVVFRLLIGAAKMLLGLFAIASLPAILVGGGIWVLLRPLYERIARRPLGSGDPDAETSAHAEATAAKTRVVDGDTVVIRGERIRIAHIDAPETGQIHLGTGADAGRAATAALRRFLDQAQGNIEVLPIDTDAYGRTVAMLRIGPYDVGLTLVKMGMAIADRAAPEPYKEAEAWARAKKVGLWRDGGFVPPDIHRVFAN